MPGDSENDIEFVSQEEIDRLLNQGEAAAEEDAGAPQIAGGSLEAAPEGDPAAEDPSPAERFDDADLDELLEDPDFKEPPDSNAPADRVILEEVPESPGVEAARRRTVWALHKDFRIILSVACVLGIGLNLFFWNHKKRSLHVIAPQVLSFPVPAPSSDTEPLTFRSHPQGITLKNFLVPAPIERKDLTYITADVSLELTHAKAVSLIKAHAPFYRNIIYEVIQRVLRSSDKSKISEISLKIEILKALNGSIPQRSVRDVSVDTFVMF